VSEEAPFYKWENALFNHLPDKQRFCAVAF